eukprot:CAMPEP_0170073758 /NCGR_PEP_ID=MMETSP0019_2-20121128/11145_1 /TAXON_ID=98059 /ORGANISM="Dinobryon sp., Strain UTEXLB2267" /LENGTH=44 /DNA_ID= /DNA_START= /DNA_END= /DNA_ORIENTATION=
MKALLMSPLFPVCPGTERTNQLLTPPPNEGRKEGMEQQLCHNKE